MTGIGVIDDSSLFIVEKYCLSESSIERLLSVGPISSAWLFPRRVGLGCMSAFADVDAGE